jgi:hypothetical protein
VVFSIRFSNRNIVCISDLNHACYMPLLYSLTWSLFQPPATYSKYSPLHPVHIQIIYIYMHTVVRLWASFSLVKTNRVIVWLWETLWLGLGHCPQYALRIRSFLRWAWPQFWPVSCKSWKYLVTPTKSVQIVPKAPYCSYQIWPAVENEPKPLPPTSHRYNLSASDPS